MNITMKQALQLREQLLKIAPNLDDKTASSFPMLFEPMKYDGEKLLAGTKINWKNTVKRLKVDADDIEENNPEINPILWENV